MSTTLTTEQYGLTARQREVRERCGALARGPVAEGAAARDRDAAYPHDMFALLREEGLLRLPFPARYGGEDEGILTCLLAMEELTKACYNTSYLLMMTWQPFYAMAFAGTEEQQDRWLPGLASGELRFSTSATEPQAGSDMAGLRLPAERVDGGYRLTGRKMWAGNANVADFIIVWARTDEHPTRGLTAFVVPSDAEGLTLGEPIDKIGGRAIPSGQLDLDGVFVRDSHRLGEEGSGFRLAATTFTKLRPLVGGRALGLAQGALDHAVGYVKERRAFGQPLADFQGLRWMLADMKTRIEAARHMTYKSAAILDAGVPTRDAAAFVGGAKTFATDTAMQVTIDALQVHGATGCRRGDGFPMERFMREAKGLQILEGPNEVQKNLVAGDLLASDAPNPSAEADARA